MAKGATHYAHLFFPLTGAMAEKHDSFISPDGDGGAISEFPGKLLVQGEPDALELPERRHPPDLRGARLHGLGRDQPRLRASTPRSTSRPRSCPGRARRSTRRRRCCARSRRSTARRTRILKLFGHKNIANVVAYAGAEQEYFLVDRRFFMARARTC